MSYSAVSGKALIVALKRIGFEEIRVRGSHRKLQCARMKGKIVRTHRKTQRNPIKMQKTSHED
jgi:predicted RNA binding protein YcfA (HicA-like mRNA interferase family)